ncbi:MAG: DNA gyrase subunit A [Pseudomonadales bacterium]|nr:DNA gyrase subunit A [Pseudomonadales bacterium]
MADKKNKKDNEKQIKVAIENLTDDEVKVDKKVMPENNNISDETNNGENSENSESENASQESQSQEVKQSLIGTIEETKFGKMKYISIKSEMEKSYLDYAMSVIVSRALPDVRDGLKPVHRRILFSMHKTGIHWNSSYKKSARIVGDVLGKYHPHGDAPVYMAMVRLAQDFSMRYELIDGQGNFGSVDGDSPAAMRYTEARMEKITRELLVDIDKNTVPFIDNFDGSLKEPTVLPGKLPNLLLMGSEGIAVGMATKIPPHNLTEVINAIIATINKGESKIEEGKFVLPIRKEATPKSNNNKDDEIKSMHAQIDALLETDSSILSGNFESEITIDEIMEHINGPDFPTAGIIYDFNAIKEGYQTGKGKVVIRAKTKIEEDNKGQYQIIVTELPYQVNKARLLQKIASLVRDKKITGIKDLNDDSDRNGLQITIELKRDARPKVVLNKLFKYSELQTSFSMNMVALNSNGTPQLMNIRQILMEYIKHRQQMIVKRSQYNLEESRNRAHILEGLLIALANLDDVIDTIRKSKTTEDAKEALMKKFGLSELQSLAILEMQLKRLAALERLKIEEEYEAIKKILDDLIKLLDNPKEILKVIVDEANELVSLYGDERRTRLVKGKIGEFSEQDLVPNEEAVITLTETGYIKRLSPSSFRSQSRGGKGSVGVKMKDEDVVQTLLTVETHDTLLVFTDMGRVFRLKAFEIPESSRTAKGTAVVNILSLKAEEKVLSILVVNEEKDQERFIVLATVKGLIKKTPVKLFGNIRQNGIIAITLNDDDSLVKGMLTTGENDIMLITHNGKSIRFSEKEVKSSQRDTKGVKGITIKKDDYVVGFEVISQEEIDDSQCKSQLLLVTENGMGKRTKLDQYPKQKRSGMGVKVADITKRTGLVASARKVNSDEHKEVVITTREGQTIKLPLTKKSIPTLTRPTQGVILMRLKSNNKVAAVALTFKKAEGEE